MIVIKRHCVELEPKQHMGFETGQTTLLLHAAIVLTRQFVTQSLLLSFYILISGKKIVNIRNKQENAKPKVHVLQTGSQSHVMMYYYTYSPPS